MATSGTTNDDTTTDTTVVSTARPAPPDEDQDQEQDVLIHLDPPAVATSTLSDLLRGAVGGVVAGAAFMGLMAWSSVAAGASPLDPFRSIATLVVTGETAELGRGAIFIGAALHGVVVLAAGLLFALMAPLLRRHDALVGAGIAYGGVLHLVNLLAFGQATYPEFRQADAVLGLTASLLFGALLGASFARIRLPGERKRDVVGQWAARAVGALAAAVTLFLYLALAPQYLEDELYVGVLVLTAAVAMTYVAIQLARRADLAAWVVGVLVSIGMVTAYVLERTSGLPEVGGTGGALGLAAAVAEGVFLVAFVAALIGRRRRRTRLRKVSTRRSTGADMAAKQATTEG